VATVRTLLVALGTIIALMSCVSAPSTERETAPPWVTSTPPSSSEYTYFVGRGADTHGNLAAANEEAIRSLAADVTRYLGVATTSQTTIETREDLKSFEMKLTESIREPSTAKSEDFGLVDRWTRRDGSQVTVFLLGRYKTSALQTEKSRVQALERERTDAVALSEKEGDRLLARGRPLSAAKKYLQAASASTGPQITDARVKFERNIKKAEEAISSIRLRIVSGDLHGRVGRPLPKPFEVEVSGSAGGSTVPLSNLPFIVSYPILRNDGRQGTETMSVTSDPKGIITVKLPPPQLLGEQSVTVSLDMSPELAALRAPVVPDRPLVTALEKRIGAVRVVLHYATTSEAASIPTGVLVIDLDRGGTPIPHDDTSAGIVNALTQAGFSILPIPSNRSILGIDDPDLVKIVRNNFGNKIKRVILGKARISGFEQSDGTYIVKVSGNVEVADLATGKVLLSATQIKLSRASDASSAITAAFKDLGTSIGDEIKNRLR